MATPLTLDDVQRAWEARDPDLVKYIEILAGQPDPQPQTPIRQGALTFQKFLSTIHRSNFRTKPEEEQRHYRVETIATLEAPDGEVPLPDRLKLHEIVYKLWQDNGPFARQCLLGVIATVPLNYGPWRALKRIFKEAEEKDDTEIFGALAARLDTALGTGGFQPSRLTLAYMVRRAWRYYRRLGTRLPACYADACVDLLSCYAPNTSWNGTWVANHVFFHETKAYSRIRFTVPHGTTDLLKHRAFADLWQRTPRPLFSLLERARNERVWEFATMALRTDFRAVLREVEPQWVARLVGVGSKTIDEFVVWILQNVPRFEQASFRTLGLHEAVLRLFDSPSNPARVYAAEYARTHARDLPVRELIRLANNNNETVRKLANDLLQARDPRTEIGLEAWGELLETNYGHTLAAATIKKHFGARELTPEWFKTRLLSANANAFGLAKTLLPQVHPFQKLGTAFFCDLIDSLNEPNELAARNVPGFVLPELAKFDLNALDVDFLRRLLLNPMTRRQTMRWIDEGRLQARTLGADFLKIIGFYPDWPTDPWMTALRQGGKKWAQDLTFDESLTDQVLTWLKDPRRFTPSDLGFDWLMRMVARPEARYHDFAVDTMVKSFLPGDFAPKPVGPASRAGLSEGAARLAAPTSTASVDLGGATFLFTGKLATMTRKEAEDKVKGAKGANLSAVSAKLHYLVIGDEGSPLYGQGKKGSKQVKAEELNAGGANIRIISETAFLQMLSGARTTQPQSEDVSLAGSERLWEMAIAPGNDDVSLGRFARRYIRRHHPDIAMEETDRPVDPGAEIPASFFTFERVEPLFHETRKPLREFALKIARWEFSRWAPPVKALLKLAESLFSEVRAFLAQALLADDAPEHKRYRIDPANLTPAAVYSFCESPDEDTRDLGMKLIQRHDHLKVPEELFRLTESPDRKVRAFVIRVLWSLYRERGITTGWKPHVAPSTALGQAAPQRGDGPPARPAQLPATQGEMRAFFRRVLFEIPPARAESIKKPEEGEQSGIRVRMRPLPARRAKRYLVEVMRDLALEDSAFAAIVVPVLEEFMLSRGASERAVCLVAVTRIRHQHSRNGELLAVTQA